MDGRKYQSATENPNSLTGPEILGLPGLQRQVLQNAVTIVMATLRGLGSVAVLIWVSPTIEAFFIWQGIVSVATALIFMGVVYKILPKPPRAARFSLLEIRNIWKFAAGMMGMTFLALRKFPRQVDHSKVETLALARASAGVIPSRPSWSLSSLYSSIQAQVISRTSSRLRNSQVSSTSFRYERLKRSINAF